MKSRALVGLFLSAIALSILSNTAHAQLYVSQQAGRVGEYDAITGAAINANFITGLNNPFSLALSGNDLFVAEFSTQRVGKYDATTGAAINPNFITGLTPARAQLSANNLFVASRPAGTVREYSAITGALINPNFITGLTSPAGLAFQVQAVPEPSTWAVSALCFAALLFRRFSRRPKCFVNI